MGNLVKDLKGKRFGKLIVIELVYCKDKVRKVYWKCMCDCGIEKVISARSLGVNTNSCGCLKTPKENEYIEIMKKKLLSHIIIDGNGCWIWKKALAINGYGKIAWKEKSMPAHRISYSLFIGKIPNGTFVCHKCDVKSCVNPEHLFLGTHTENMKDMHRKGRGNSIDEKGRFMKKQIYSEK